MKLGQKPVFAYHAYPCSFIQSGTSSVGSRDTSIHPFPVTNKRARQRRPSDEVSPLSDSQQRWLARGLEQAGGKLPLFDEDGQRYNEKTIQSCLEKGWAEPWFKNPIKPDWLICRLTDHGREVLSTGT